MTEPDELDIPQLQEEGAVCDYALGVLTVKLRIPGAQSLKDKRHVVKSTLANVRKKFSVSAAEIDSLDNLRLAGLAFSFVANDRRLVNSVLSKALDYIESNPESEVIAHEIDVS